MAEALKANRLTRARLDELRQLGTCITASAIETFGVRMHNTGFADSRIRCQFKELPAVVGYAATARIRAAEPPMDRHGYFYYDRADWWHEILTVPDPRV